MANFDASVCLVLRHEGTEYTENPSDSGGATRYGITIKTLAAVRGLQVTRDDVKALTQDDAKAIYRMAYWEPLKLSQVSAQMCANVIFDQGVLCGIGTAIKRAQIALKRLNKNITIDGKMGVNTINAINSCDPIDFAVEFIIESQDYLADIAIHNATQVTFIKGWLRRTHDLLRDILQLK